MKTHKLTTLLGTLALAALVLIPGASAAAATRELITTFGSLEKIAGIGIDLETGNVYVADDKTRNVYIFGTTGGAPAGGVPTEIEGGLHIAESSPEGEALTDNPAGIAIDNSCYIHRPRLTGHECEEYDPSYGDMYIIDETSYGEYQHEQKEEPGILKFRLNSEHKYELVGQIVLEYEPSGVAVDPQGDIFIEGGRPGANVSEPVIEFRKIVEKGENGEVEERLEEKVLPQRIVRYNTYLAADDHGDVYVGSADEGGPADGGDGVAKLTVGEAGNELSEMVFVSNHSETERPLAVNTVNDDVYVGDQSQVNEYNSEGALQLTFGSEEALGGSLGRFRNGVKAIAVNGESELVYVANPLHNDIDVFGGIANPPKVSPVQPGVSGVTRTSALLAGTVNPGANRANYYFEYVPGEEYDPSAEDPYAQGGRTAITALAGGTIPETVERITLTGLRPGVTYHYRMVVVNAAATEYGPDETFTTSPATPPLASTGPAVGVSATAVTLTGSIQPRGLPTSYVFEVGPDTSYDGARLFGEAGSSTGEVHVSVALQYLIPGTTYYYRLAATSFDGTSYGQAGTFTTPSVTAPLTQPAAAVLIASPAMAFPSIAGAIDKPAGKSKTRVTRAKARVKHRRAGSSGRLKRALRACAKQRSETMRSRCRAQARRLYGPGVKSNHSTKR